MEFGNLNLTKENKIYEKNDAIILLCFAVPFLIIGCETQKESQMVQIGNPWSEWNSIGEAEAATRFSFGLPNSIADCYTASEFRTMNNEMIEVIYTDPDGKSEVCVRKQKGEGQDISGDYNEYQGCSEKNYHGGNVTVYNNSLNSSVKVLVSYQGYSWSLVAPNGFLGESDQDFLNLLCK